MPSANTTWACFAYVHVTLLPYYSLPDIYYSRTSHRPLPLPCPLQFIGYWLPYYLNAHSEPLKAPLNRHEEWYTAHGNRNRCFFYTQHITAEVDVVVFATIIFWVWDLPVWCTDGRRGTNIYVQKYQNMWHFWAIKAVILILYICSKSTNIYIYVYSCDWRIICFFVCKTIVLSFLSTTVIARPKAASRLEQSAVT